MARFSYRLKGLATIFGFARLEGANEFTVACGTEEIERRLGGAGIFERVFNALLRRLNGRHCDGFISVRDRTNSPGGAEFSCRRIIGGQKLRLRFAQYSNCETG
jgi:hypothetical protein